MVMLVCSIARFYPTNKGFLDYLELLDPDDVDGGVLVAGVEVVFVACASGKISGQIISGWSQSRAPT